jgi:putative endonuclease
MSYTVYILYSRLHKKIYIGYTSHLIERFKSHNSSGTNGWTIKFRPWEVIYCEYCSNKPEAINRERVLKGARGREWIHQKIKTQLEQFGFISA